jgi:hypothetical protein
VAAAAALAALLFAWRTVRDAEAARRDAYRDHQSEMSARRAATEASAAARDRALAAECVLEQLRQLERIAEVVLTITNAAQHEMEQHQHKTEHQPHPAGELSPSRLPPLLGRLHNALAVLTSLGGPPLPVTVKLATIADSGADGKQSLVYSNARLAVPEIQAAAGFDERLRDLVAQNETRAAGVRPS